MSRNLLDLTWAVIERKSWTHPGTPTRTSGSSLWSSRPHKTTDAVVDVGQAFAQSFSDTSSTTSSTSQLSVPAIDEVLKGGDVRLAPSRYTDLGADAGEKKAKRTQRAAAVSLQIDTEMLARWLVDYLGGRNVSPELRAKLSKHLE